MLADERSKDFVRNFTMQWLSLAKMKTVPINNELFPRFLYYVSAGERRGTEQPYRPTIRDSFIMPGREVWQEMQNWLQKTHKKGYLTPHDVTTGTQIARIVTGGDVDPSTVMTEDDLFAMERKAFLTLAKTEQTRKRIQHMLSYGKPLRN